MSIQFALVNNAQCPSFLSYSTEMEQLLSVMWRPLLIEYLVARRNFRFNKGANIEKYSFNFK